MTYWSYQRCYSCSGKAQSGSVALMKYTLEKFPYARSMGIYACRDVRGGSSLSIHACGRALDVGIPVLSTGRANTELGNPIVKFFDQFSTQFGIMGQIYNRVRYDRGDPRGAYYGGVHPHYDHDHVEQRSEKATTLTYAEIVSIAGPATPTSGGSDMLLKKGSTGQAVAELQKIMNERFKQNNGSFTPLAGKSQFDGQPFAPGEDGDFGPTCETNVKNVQGILGQAKTGVVDDLLWSALVYHRYGSTGGGGLSATEVDAKIAAHASQRASTTIHPHGHDEGSTGPAK